MSNIKYFNEITTIDCIDWMWADSHAHIINEFGCFFKYGWASWIQSEKLDIDAMYKYKNDIFTYCTSHNICKYQNLTFEFIKENINKLSISDVVHYLYNTVDEKFLSTYVGKYNIHDLVKKRTLSIEFLDRHFPTIGSFTSIAPYQSLSEEFILKHIKVTDDREWDSLIKGYSVLSEDFLEDNIKHINFNKYALTRKLSTPFIDKHINKFSFNILETNQDLDEDFIRKYISYVDFANISEHQKLSESFINDYTNRFRWDKIVKHQTHLSKTFLDSHRDKINKFIIFSDEIK